MKFKQLTLGSKRKLIVGLPIALLTLTALAFLFYPSFYNGPSYRDAVKEVWLPPTTNEEWFDEGFRSAVEKVKVVHDEYGDAVLFNSTEPMDFEIYIANKSRGLRISKCPDVFNIKSDGATCELVGAMPGSLVYAMSPSLASGAGVGYMTRGDVFIAFKTGGDASTSNVFKDARSFKRVDSDKVDALLASNKAEVEKHNVVVRKAISDEKYRETQAYLHLPFMPYLPSSLPSGWRQDSLEIIATDPEKPTFVEARYSNGAEFVTLRIGKLSQFKLDTTCGPSPGAGGEHLKCAWYPQTGYYRSVTQGDDYTQNYIYKPIGDSLAIIDTSNCCDIKKPPILASTLSAQEFITQSLQRIDIAQLKDAIYHDMVYF